jgi:hypothetical protein
LQWRFHVLQAAYICSHKHIGSKSRVNFENSVCNSFTHLNITLNSCCSQILISETPTTLHADLHYSRLQQDNKMQSFNNSSIWASNFSFSLGLSVYILSLLSSKSSPKTSGDGCCLSWTDFVSEAKSDSDHLLLELAGQSPESPKDKFMLQMCTTNKFPSSKDLQWWS